MTYEPYLVRGARRRPTSGKIIATTLDYPMIMDTVRLHAEVPRRERRRSEGACG